MKTLLSLFLLLMLSGTIYAQNDHKWHYLFDGKSVNELRGYKMEIFPDAWKVEDGALVAQTDVPNVDLVTKDTYTDFDLTLEWAVSKAGNSGIFIMFRKIPVMNPATAIARIGLIILSSRYWMTSILTTMNHDVQQVRFTI